tara:strand:+ start:721 stop:1590 length:870 start_codon:yes stop_codon:yes gene_type:complete
MALSSVVKKALKKAAAAARKESGEAGAKRRAAKKKAEEAKKKASKKAAKSPKATQKGVRFKKKAELQEGMGLDAITGRDIRAAVDVDKGKAGKVTRSPEPGFLQQQRTEGGRKRAKRRVEAEEKARAGDKGAKKTVERMTRQDELDTARARAKASATSRGRKKPQRTDYVDPETGEVFGNPTKQQLERAAKNFQARGMSGRAREIMARLDELEPTKAGESGVRRRSGGPKGMRGATERNIKDIDEGVGGRGGLDFRKGGAVKKKAIGATDYRMNKGGLLLSSVDNRKKR